MPGALVASVEKQTGRIQVGVPGSENSSARVLAETSLKSGEFIQTGVDSRLAATWLNGESLRLDEQTRVLLVSENRLDLISGRIYIDSNSVEPGLLSIATPQGMVRHLGTRYMTRFSKGELLVSVRQGKVEVSGPSETALASAGQQLSISINGVSSLAPIAVFGDDWAWLEQVSPAYNLDGRSMADFLDWVSRETGRAVEYASADARELARDTLMRGSVDLSPMRAMELMLQTSDLAAKVRAGGVIEVSIDNPEKAL
jgi:ferric-dicitrate binding protein FerR (iron transport regulator)